MTKNILIWRMTLTLMLFHYSSLIKKKVMNLRYSPTCKMRKSLKRSNLRESSPTQKSSGQKASFRLMILLRHWRMFATRDVRIGLMCSTRPHPSGYLRWFSSCPLGNIWKQVLRLMVGCSQISTKLFSHYSSAATLFIYLSIN